nr:unnamed protein product [Spirometra erinaceieuropaei]
MGSPLSGLIAEAVLQRLERLVFRSYSPKFWARYVDDTFVVIKRNDVQDFKVLLNSIFPDIQFTMEEEYNNQLPFLDVNITRMANGGIRTTVYRKATNTRRILQFRSNHPIGHKRSCVRALFQRVQTHCNDNDGRREEVKYLHSLFTANGYPRSFIRECRRGFNRERSNDEKPNFWLAIPYMRNVSEATARILSPFGIGVAHKPESTIRQQIMRPKGQLPATEQSAVVYSIPCQDCGARYVGETGKRLCTRLHEHQLAVNREDKLSLVYGHIQQEKHSFAFGEASIIGRASDKMARLVLESWSSVDTINRAIDLHPAYQALRTRLQSARTGPTALANKSWLSQQLSPSQQGERASRVSDDRREISTHRRAQTADPDSHMQRQLISPSNYGGRAQGHTDLAATTAAGQGAEVTPAPQQSATERPKPIPRQQAVLAWYAVVYHINEHKLAIRWRDPLSLVFAHALDYDHRFNWDGTEVVAMANTKRAREFLEAWYSDAGSINRHVDLDAHYEGLRSRMTAPCPNYASTTANTAARILTDSPPALPLQHGVP